MPSHTTAPGAPYRPQVCRQIRYHSGLAKPPGYPSFFPRDDGNTRRRNTAGSLPPQGQRSAGRCRLSPINCLPFQRSSMTKPAQSQGISRTGHGTGGQMGGTQAPAHLLFAYVLSQLCVQLFARRLIPTRPIRPEARSSAAPGMGTGATSTDSSALVNIAWNPILEILSKFSTANIPS